MLALALVGVAVPLGAATDAAVGPTVADSDDTAGDLAAVVGGDAAPILPVDAPQVLPAATVPIRFLMASVPAEAEVPVVPDFDDMGVTKGRPDAPLPVRDGGDAGQRAKRDAPVEAAVPVLAGPGLPADAKQVGQIKPVPERADWVEAERAVPKAATAPVAAPPIAAAVPVARASLPIGTKDFPIGDIPDDVGRTAVKPIVAPDVAFAAQDDVPAPKVVSEAPEKLVAASVLPLAEVQRDTDAPDPRAADQRVPDPRAPDPRRGYVLSGHGDPVRTVLAQEPAAKPGLLDEDSPPVRAALGSGEGPVPATPPPVRTALGSGEGLVAANPPSELARKPIKSVTAKAETVAAVQTPSPPSVVPETPRVTEGSAPPDAAKAVQVLQAMPVAAAPGRPVAAEPDDVADPIPQEIGDVLAPASSAAPRAETAAFTAQVPSERPSEWRLPAALPPSLLQHAQAAREGPVTVLLQPEELGALRFEMHERGAAVHILLTVERPETLDLLRRHADQLVTEFRQSGFAGATVSVTSGSLPGGPAMGFAGSGQGYGGSGGEADRGAPRIWERRAEGEEPIGQGPHRRMASGGLDLRI